MIYENSRLELKRSFIRFEPNIGEGTVFIFNKESGQMLEGDYYCYLVVKALQNKDDLNELVQMISSCNGQSCSETEESVNYIIETLRMEGFLQDE